MTTRAPAPAHLLRHVLLGLAAALLAVPAAAQPAKLEVRAAVIRALPELPLPISRTEVPPEDDGFAGARRGTADNATTGGFLGHAYETLEVTVPPAEAVAALDGLLADGVRLFVTVAPADTLLAMADRAAETAPDALFINAWARDDRLRNDACRANILHVAPSRAMLADGLAQYLVWKKWDEWLLIRGDYPEDRLMAEAYARAAAKFGAEIVETLVFEDTGRARRADSGHVLVQRQIPTFTQRAEDHDVVVVADESEVFGPYIPYRTWEPRPVAGDAGLRTRNWHPAFEGWGATQLQRRFERDQGRRMTDTDYQVWLALRVLGEAVTRRNTAEPPALREFILSDAFEIAAFKGVPLTFRPWNQQLRQGVLLADGPLVVTVSPQEEFLHQRTRLDTLGFDEPESTCDLK